MAYAWNTTRQPTQPNLITYLNKSYSLAPSQTRTLEAGSLWRRLENHLDKSWVEASTQLVISDTWAHSVKPITDQR